MREPISPYPVSEKEHNVVNTIRQAIEVLARRGWTKHAFTDDDGRHCVEGALLEAHGLVVGGDHRACPLPAGVVADVRLVNQVVGEQYPERFGGVGASRFNDHPETTLDDVVVVLEKAALLRDELI